MASEKPRRRWFRPRYSLTTLFVVVTAICCWLGYSLNWIRERRAFGRELGINTVPEIGAVLKPAPGLLWVLGESGVSVITVYNRDQKTADEAKRLFPEATVVSLEMGGW